MAPPEIASFVMLLNLVLFLKPLFDPLGLLLLGLISAAIVQAARRKWPGAIFCGTMSVAMLLVVATPLVDHGMASLERPYARSYHGSVTNLDAVVMLGGLGGTSGFDVLGMDLGASADRMICAVDVAREGRVKNLVLGGGGQPGKGGVVAEGELVAEWIKKWGLTEAKMLPLPPSRNTRDEAEAVLALVQTNHWKRLALVTSAFHLPRALAVFRALDMDVTPIGCDFRVVREGGSKPPFIDWSRIDNLRLWLHEEQAWLFYRWRGWIKSGK